MSGYAELTQQRAHGFHWYSVDSIEKEQKIAPTQPSTIQTSPYEQLMEVRKQTLNKLAQALIEPSFEATYDYMKAQQAYAKNNQKFVQHWQQVLLFILNWIIPCISPRIIPRLRFVTIRKIN